MAMGPANSAANKCFTGCHGCSVARSTHVVTLAALSCVGSSFQNLLYRKNLQVTIAEFVSTVLLCAVWWVLGCHVCRHPRAQRSVMWMQQPL